MYVVRLPLPWPVPVGPAVPLPGNIGDDPLFIGYGALVTAGRPLPVPVPVGLTEVAMVDDARVRARRPANEDWTMAGLGDTSERVRRNAGGKGGIRGGWNYVLRLSTTKDSATNNESDHRLPDSFGRVKRKRAERESL